MELRFFLFCFALVEQVVEGEDAALKVGGWISSACVDRLHVEVFTILTFFSFINGAYCFIYIQCNATSEFSHVESQLNSIND